MEGTDNDRYDITSYDQVEGLEHEEVLLTDYFNRRNYSKPDVEAQLAAFKARNCTRKQANVMRFSIGTRTRSSAEYVERP